MHNILNDTDLGSLSTRLKAVSQPLEPKRKRADGGQVGFFEQGILTGLALTGVSALACIGVVGYFGIRYGLRLNH